MLDYVLRHWEGLNIPISLCGSILVNGLMSSWGKIDGVFYSICCLRCYSVLPDTQSPLQTSLKSSPRTRRKGIKIYLYKEGAANNLWIDFNTAIMSESRKTMLNTDFCFVSGKIERSQRYSLMYSTPLWCFVSLRIDETTKRSDFLALVVLNFFFGWIINFFYV